jgi:GcrA cell cycle regulator
MNARVCVSDADLAQAQREVGWTETRERVAFALYAGGMSDSQIACLIGGVTRNAVIGKRNRKGILLGVDPALAQRPQLRNDNKQRAGQPRPPRQPRIVMPRVKADEPLPPPIVDLEIPLPQRRQLADLADNCCRWPVGEPGQADFFFCGAVAKRKPGSETFHPYCASHLRRAHSQERAPRSADQLVPKLKAGRINNAWF